MSYLKQFSLPDLGEGLTEGEILTWLVSVGDSVTLNQPIVEIETAKAVVEIPSKWDGRIAEIICPAGATAKVGSPIVVVDTSLSQLGDTSTCGTAEIGNTPQPLLVGYGPTQPRAARRPKKNPTSLPEPGTEATATPSVLAKPPVRKLARDLGVDLQSLVGTGPHGSIAREDVLAAKTNEKRVPVTGVKKVSAQNVTTSALTVPHATIFMSVDMTRSIRLRDKLRKIPEWSDVHISPLFFVAKAVLSVIRRYSMVNSVWNEDEIIVRDYVNLGIAVATDRGLVVPNVKDADRLSPRDLAVALNDLVQNAKNGRVALSGMTNGTFTITNIGVFGVDAGTPILPLGQAAILALGTVREAPWVHKGNIKIRKISNIGLSFDHRVIDGELASLFLRDIATYLTNPEIYSWAWN